MPLNWLKLEYNRTTHGGQQTAVVVFPVQLGLAVLVVPCIGLRLSGHAISVCDRFLKWGSPEINPFN